MAKGRDAMSEWLNKHQGVRIQNPGRNDGVFIFINRGVNKNKEPYENVSLARFYIANDGSMRYQPRTVTAAGKRRKQYDLVSINKKMAVEIGEAIIKLVGGREGLSEASKQERDEKELRSLMR